MSDAAEVITEPAGDPAPEASQASEPAAAPVSNEAPEGPSIEKFSTWQELEAGYQELESFRGASVRIPGPDAGVDDWKAFDEKISQVEGVVRLPADGDTEAWQNFYQRLGAPASPQDYTFSDVNGEAVSYDDDAAFASQAHSLGLTRAQADGMRQYLAGSVNELNSFAAEAHQAGMSKLKESWGKAFDHNVKLAQAAAKQLEGDLPGISDYMQNTPADKLDPDTLKMVKMMGDLMGETGVIDAQRADGIMTPDEAMLQAQEIRDNPDHPYNNELDPAHQAAQNKMADLYKIAYQR